MKLVERDDSMFFEAVADPQHAMKLKSIVVSHLTQHPVAGQQRPMPGLGKRESKTVRNRKSFAFLNDRGCSQDLRGRQLLDLQSQRDQSAASCKPTPSDMAMAPTGMPTPTMIRSTASIRWGCNVVSSRSEMDRPSSIATLNRNPAGIIVTTARHRQAIEAMAAAISS